MRQGCGGVTDLFEQHVETGAGRVPFELVQQRVYLRAGTQMLSGVRRTGPHPFPPPCGEGRERVDGKFSSSETTTFLPPPQGGGKQGRVCGMLSAKSESMAESQEVSQYELPSRASPIHGVDQHAPLLIGSCPACARRISDIRRHIRARARSGGSVQPKFARHVTRSPSTRRCHIRYIRRVRDFEKIPRGNLDHGCLSHAVECAHVVGDEERVLA